VVYLNTRLVGFITVVKFVPEGAHAKSTDRSPRGA